MNIAISGVTVSGNMGGAAMLQSTIQQFENRYPNVSFKLLSVYPEEDRKAKLPSNLEIINASFVFLICVYLPICLILLPVMKLGITKSYLKRIPYLKALIECDILIDLAGVAFVDGRGILLLIYNIACCLPAIILGVPIAKLSQALGPFETSINRVPAKYILKKCKLLVARGNQSYRHLTQLGIKNHLELPDVSFSLKISNNVKEQADAMIAELNLPSKKFVIISPSQVAYNIATKKGINFVQVFSDVIDDIICLGYNILLLPHSYGKGKSKNNDVDLCHTIMNNVVQKNKVVMWNFQPDPALLRAVIGSALFMVACRFHATVAGLSSSVPTLIIGWSHKYREMANGLISDNYIVDANDINRKILLNKIKSIIANRFEIKSIIEDRIDYIKNKSQLNYNKLFELLDSRVYGNDVHPVKEIYDSGLCIGCGFCTVPAKAFQKSPKINITLNSRRTCYMPSGDDIENYKGEKIDIVCPGREIDLVKLAKLKHGKLPDYPLIGEIRRYLIARATNKSTLLHGASGGAITSILKMLFEEKEIQAVYCVGNSEKLYDAKGIYFTSINDLVNTQGSCYHPVNYGADLKKLLNGDEKFAIVGLPCHLAGFEMLKQGHPDLAKRHFISLGLFCGGVTGFDGISYYLKKNGVCISDIDKIDYRYGMWPGKIKVTLHNGKGNIIINRIQGNTRINILHYLIAFQGYWMLRRCRMCPDQINDLADISFGDPHLPRFKSRKENGLSIVISRTNSGDNVVRKAISRSVLTHEYITKEEIIASQGYTLKNRRHTAAYIKIAKIFGMKAPIIRNYPEFKRKYKIQHFVYAFVDLGKLKISKIRSLRKIYIPMQIFEYLFLTFAPGLIFKRLAKIIKNR